MSGARKLMTCDCETDPFKHKRVPIPFLWGLYDGRTYTTFRSTDEFVAAVRNRKIVLYAHNGGKFDYMYLLGYVGETRVQIINSRIVSMMLGDAELRDSFSIVPVAMKEIQKEDIEMWKLEADVREQHMEEILFRNRTDCVYLYNLVKSYREIAGTQKTIASNALAFSKKLGIDPGKTNHRFDRDFRPFFFGGRTQCFKQGSFKNISLLDIHSAYPFAMTHNHPTGSDFFWKDSIDGMSDDQISRSFIVIECTSRGAFPMRMKSGLEFPHEYNEFHVTGWEYLAARDLGLIDNIQIHSVRHTHDTITFDEYVQHWYAYKNAHSKKTNPIEYTIGKIMMNSLYGKLAQNPANYFDYKIVAGGTPICYEPEAKADDNETCGVCDKPMLDHGWKLEKEYGQHEIHIRESLWRFKYRYGIEWEAKGLYKNVATGASITGFTRSHLLRAMHGLGIENILYCDTDGIACTAGANFDALSYTDALGDWEKEDMGSPIGHFGGKKLYAIQLTTGKEKLATKGSRLKFSDIVKVVNGETILWENPAPTFSIDGSAAFIHREIRRTSRVKAE
jgi:hypothetical protein